MMFIWLLKISFNGQDAKYFQDNQSGTMTQPWSTCQLLSTKAKHHCHCHEWQTLSSFCPFIVMRNSFTWPCSFIGLLQWLVDSLILTLQGRFPSAPFPPEMWWCWCWWQWFFDLLWGFTFSFLCFLLQLLPLWELSKLLSTSSLCQVESFKGWWSSLLKDPEWSYDAYDLPPIVNVFSDPHQSHFHCYFHFKSAIHGGGTSSNAYHHCVCASSVSSSSSHHCHDWYCLILSSVLF